MSPQKHEATCDVGQVYALRGDPEFSGGPLSALAYVDLVDMRHGHRFPGRVLDCPCQLYDLCRILVIRRGDMQCQEGTHHIDGQMNLAALAPLGPVPATRHHFRHALEGPTVENYGARRDEPTFPFADQFPQIRKDRFEDAHVDRAPRLLLDRMPLLEIVGQEAASKAGAGTH